MTPLGQRLTVKIEKFMVSAGISPDAFAKKIGISTSSLRASARSHWAHASPETLRAIASILGMPTTTVFLLAGHLSPDDFFTDHIHDDLCKAGEILNLEGWERLSKNTKIFIALLAEAAGKGDLITKPVSVSESESESE